METDPYNPDDQEDYEATNRDMQRYFNAKVADLNRNVPLKDLIDQVTAPTEGTTEPVKQDCGCFGAFAIGLVGLGAGASYLLLPVASHILERL